MGANGQELRPRCHKPGQASKLVQYLTARSWRPRGKALWGALQHVRRPKGCYKAEQNLAHPRADLTRFHGLPPPNRKCKCKGICCSMQPLKALCPCSAGLTALEPYEASKISLALKRSGGGILRGPNQAAVCVGGVELISLRLRLHHAASCGSVVGPQVEEMSSSPSRTLQGLGASSAGNLVL